MLLHHPESLIILAPFAVALVGTGIFVAVTAISVLFYSFRKLKVPKIRWENPMDLLRDYKTNKQMTYRKFRREIEDAGYGYDPVQDIFYSTMNPWQRQFGYCRLYDEAQTLLGLIVDSEPIHFHYGGKKWMIELWKGQYGMTTGGEVGVYTLADTAEPKSDYDVPIYDCAGDEDLLPMSMTLIKNGKPLFKRSQRHWWLTGFKLGEFSELSELSMVIEIYLKDAEMCQAFLAGLWSVGYTSDEVKVDVRRNGVLIHFTKPHTPQPAGRIPALMWLGQRRSEALCKLYREMTQSSDSLQTKIEAIRRTSPELFTDILKLGRVREVYRAYPMLHYPKHK